MNITESLDRILSSKDSLGELFYECFLTKFPEVQKYFSDVDMRRQSVLLTNALVLVHNYSEKGYLAIELYLQLLGTKHSDRKIPKELYPQWIEAMLASLEQFHGAEWSDQLASEWRGALDRATEVMFDGYAQRFHV